MSPNPTTDDAVMDITNAGQQTPCDLSVAALRMERPIQLAVL
jgi:hypothetical protein